MMNVDQSSLIPNIVGRIRRLFGVMNGNKKKKHIPISIIDSGFL